MRLQVCAHHPLGVHEDEHGAWSSSVNHWKVGWHVASKACFLGVMRSDDVTRTTVYTCGKLWDRLAYPEGTTLKMSAC